MPKQSAGVLLFRRKEGLLQVFLVHPGGPFWAKKDEGAWTIPKGEYGPDEDPLKAAVREFHEETGTPVSGEFLTLQAITQASGKRVLAWAVEGDIDADSIRSNTFTTEWPPRSGRQREFPEVDRGSWFTVEQARQKILAAQAPLLEELEQLTRGR
jgi:predicted NUDIX family NTP pyrophosphohydrolase